MNQIRGAFKGQYTDKVGRGGLGTGARREHQARSPLHILGFWLLIPQPEPQSEDIKDLPTSEICYHTHQDSLEEEKLESAGPLDRVGFPGLQSPPVSFLNK